ncbi:MAG: TonB-dependent receptor [Pseudomonadota bacterium]|nr:TonB-dependent receptor [Pseudomonadota bacterium]
MTISFARRAAQPAFAISAFILSSLALAQTSPEVLVTATRTPQVAIDILADHTLISSEEIVRSGASNIIDLLQKQRGIEVVRNGGPGTSSSVLIRGADAKQSVVLIDGIRVASSTTGSANWAALPLSNIERIEIVYGPLAALYGADAIGGVVQIFTRQGSGAPHVTASFSAGSEQARNGDIGISGKSGGFSYAIAAARDQDDGFSATRPGSASYNPDNDGYQRDSANARFTADINADSQVGLQYLHSRLQAQYDSGASNFDTRSIQDLDNVAVFANARLAPNWRLQAQAAQADDKSISISTAAARGTSIIETRQNQFSIQSDLTIGPDLLQVLLERREETVLSGSTAALNTGRATNSVGASYSLKRGANLATASVRRDNSSQYGGQTTGGIGYGYRFTPALRANASAGTSFRAPTFNDLYFPGFGVATNQPEKGRNVEGGLYWNDSASEASVVYFHNRLTDMLVTAAVCPVEPATHTFGCAYNVGRATLSGVTIGGRTRLYAVDLRGSLDFQDPRDDTTGKTLARRSKRHASFTAEYTQGALTTGAGLQVSGRRFDDAANKNTLGGYGLFNLFAQYQLAADWSLLARWNNVANKKYELARNYGTAGSQVFIGVRYGMR